LKRPVSLVVIVAREEPKQVYLAPFRNKDEIQGSFTPFRMTTSRGRIGYIRFGFRFNLPLFSGRG
jgi:hypothetical protein